MTLYAEFVDRIVRRGSPPTLGELAHLVTLREIADENHRRLVEQWGRPLALRVDLYEWSPVPADA